MAQARYDTPEPFKVDIPERALIDLDERLRRWRPPIAIADERLLGLRHRSRLPGRSRRLLAPRLRLAALPGGHQPLAELPGRHRPPAPALHPRARHRGRGRAAPAAARRHARLAGLDRRVPRHLCRRWRIPSAHGGDPLDAFDVIVPSLPGYGFSGPPIRADGSTRADRAARHRRPLAPAGARDASTIAGPTACRAATGAPWSRPGAPSTIPRRKSRTNGDRACSACT